MKLEALDHPKTYDFAARLNVSRPTAIGHLELLWAFVAQKAPHGNIGKWPDGAIARACDWMGDPAQFVNILRECGFLDADSKHRLLVHDWAEHAPRWVKLKLDKIKQSFVVSTPESAAEPTTERTVEQTAEPSSRVGKGSVGKGREEKDLCPAERDRASDPPELADSTDPAARVFAHWRDTHEHPRAHLDPKRRKVIRAALENYSEADLCRSISGYRNSPHHMGENDRKTVYDDIELLLRDAKHIEAGLRFHDNPPNNLSRATRKAVANTVDWQPPEARSATQ